MITFLFIPQSSSSCRAASTDIPDHLSPLLPITHRLRQVLWVTNRREKLIDCNGGGTAKNKERYTKERKKERKKQRKKERKKERLKKECREKSKERR